MAAVTTLPVTAEDCRCVYVDKRLSEELAGVDLENTGSGGFRDAAVRFGGNGNDITSKIDRQIDELKCNIRALLNAFKQIHVCTSGSQCLAKLKVLETQSDREPVIVIVDTPIDHNAIESGETTDGSTVQHSLEYPYGIRLLRALRESGPVQLILTVAMLRRPSEQWRRSGISASVNTANHVPQYEHLGLSSHNIKAAHLQDPVGVKHVCDIGAVDVVMSPLQPENLRHLKSDLIHIQTLRITEGLESLAIHKLGRGSLLGYESQDIETLQRSQLLERLTHTILNPQQGRFGILESVPSFVLPYRRQKYLKAISSWRFPAHEFENEDLEHIACLTLEHCLSLSGLEKYRISRNQLGLFVRACRNAYNDSVQYHNFRHVIDVMQATFYFLLQLGIIPPIPEIADAMSWEPIKVKSPVNAVIDPKDALTLLVAAIGHDVGHPGLNNGFLAKIKSPIAQIYSDNSVLENFHCAAHTQILRQYWPTVYEDAGMRKTLTGSILATDMFLHNKYISDMNEMRRWIEQQNSGAPSFEALKQFKFLICGLLLKCADISNVARPYDIALRWGEILQLEFAAQSDLADRLGVESSLFGGKPEVGNQSKLAKSQTGFMNVFAKSLFQGVAQIFPIMTFSVVEMEKNTIIFDKIVTEAERLSSSEGGVSPKSRTPERSTAQTTALASPDITSSDAPEQVHEPAAFGTKLGSGAFDVPRRSSADSRRSSQGLSPRSGNTPPKQSSSRRSSSNVYHPSVGEPRRSSAASVHRQASSALSQQHSENTHPTKNGSESESTLSPSSVAPTSFDQGRSDRSSSGGGDGGDYPGGIGGSLGMDGTSDDRNGSTVSSSYRSIHSNGQQSNNSNRRISSSHGSTHHRDSSGNHTSIVTQASPYSPATTQATSFITVDSDEKGYSSNNGHSHAEWSPSSTRKKSVPDKVDVERPGSGPGSGLGANYCNHNTAKSSSTHAATQKYGSLKADLLVSSVDAAHSNGSQRSIQRKSSRFKIHNLWKRARRSGGVEGTP